MDLVEPLETRTDRTSPVDICKGLFFRLRLNTYYQDGRYVEKKEMRLLKRLSCKGCAKCGWIEENLREEAFGSPPIEIDEEVDQGIYIVGVTDISRDCETGIVDDWRLIFKLQKGIK